MFFRSHFKQPLRTGLSLPGLYYIPRFETLIPYKAKELRKRQVLGLSPTSYQVSTSFMGKPA